MRMLLPLIILLPFAIAPALAQSLPPSAEEEDGIIQPAESERESIQVGLSTDRISISSDFTGTNLTIFGAVDNVDPALAREHRYDIVVVLEGPTEPAVVRRKERVLGIWMNTASQTFLDVPASYSMATTRPRDMITSAENYEYLALGPDHIYLAPADAEAPRQRVEEFGAALRERKRESGLYNERVGGVQFLSQNLFRATVALAPNVPVGVHRARAMLFRDGEFIGQSSASLGIYKAGFEQRVYEAAHDYSLLYGFFAVALAMMTGWVGSIVFRRE